MFPVSSHKYNPVFPPEQLTGVVDEIVAVGFEFTVTVVTADVVEHPLELVTVTV